MPQLMLATEAFKAAPNPVGSADRRVRALSRTVNRLPTSATRFCRMSSSRSSKPKQS